MLRTPQGSCRYSDVPLKGEHECDPFSTRSSDTSERRIVKEQCNRDRCRGARQIPQRGSAVERSVTRRLSVTQDVEDVLRLDVGEVKESAFGAEHRRKNQRNHT